MGNQKSEIEEDESSNFDQLIQNKILPTTVRLMNNFVDDKNEKVSKPNKGYTIFTREEVEDVCVICLNNFNDCSHFQVDLLDQKLNEEKNIHRAHNSQWHEECIVQWIKVNSNCPLCHEILKDPRVQENNTTAVQIVPNNDDMMYWKEYFLINFLMTAIIITLIVSFPDAVG